MRSTNKCTEPRRFCTRIGGKNWKRRKERKNSNALVFLHSYCFTFPSIPSFLPSSHTSFISILLSLFPPSVLSFSPASQLPQFGSGFFFVFSAPSFLLSLSLAPLPSCLQAVVSGCPMAPPPPYRGAGLISPAVKQLDISGWSFHHRRKKKQAFKITYC